VDRLLSLTGKAGEHDLEAGDVDSESHHRVQVTFKLEAGDVTRNLGLVEHSRISGAVTKR
jgi:hypothetical protein